VIDPDHRMIGMLGHESLLFVWFDIGRGATPRKSCKNCKD
jgi:hypothetical protein